MNTEAGLTGEQAGRIHPTRRPANPCPGRPTTQESHFLLLSKMEQLEMILSVQDLPTLTFEQLKNYSSGF